MITLTSVQLNNHKHSTAGNVRIPRPRFTQNANFKNEADTFTPSFCSNNSQKQVSKLGEFFKKLTDPDLSEGAQRLQDSIPSAFKY